MTVSNANSDFQDYPLGNISKPSFHDVLCGRGRTTNNHAGNIRFRELINLHKIRYRKATKVQKPDVAREVVEIWRTQSPPGRFLTVSNATKARPTNNKIWHDIGDNKAQMKTSQCLRERNTDVIQIDQAHNKKKIQSSITKNAESEMSHKIDENKIPTATKHHLQKQTIGNDLIMQPPQDENELHEFQTYLAKEDEIINIITKSNPLRDYADKSTDELHFRQFQVMQKLHILHDQQRLLELQTLASLSSNINDFNLKHVKQFDFDLNERICSEQS